MPYRDYFHLIKATETCWSKVGYFLPFKEAQLAPSSCEMPLMLLYTTYSYRTVRSVSVDDLKVVGVVVRIRHLGVEAWGGGNAHLQPIRFFLTFHWFLITTSTITDGGWALLTFFTLDVILTTRVFCFFFLGSVDRTRDAWLLLTFAGTPFLPLARRLYPQAE